MVWLLNGANMYRAPESLLFWTCLNLRIPMSSKRQSSQVKKKNIWIYLNFWASSNYVNNSILQFKNRFFLDLDITV